MGRRLQLPALCVLALILAVMALASTAHGQEVVTLAWDANPESDIAGYTIYCGTTSGQLSQVLDVAGQTTAVLAGLIPATTYYCAVQAYNTAGLTSALSAEISFATKPASIAVTVAWNANPESDIAGYKVHLGTASATYAQIQDVGAQTTAVLSGLTPLTTYYCAVQAYNTAGLESELSDEISFTTPSPEGLFNTWAAAATLSGGPDAAPFHDGVANLLKYAFNLNAKGPDLRVLATGTGTAGLPAFALERIGTQHRFKVEFLRRKGSGLVYAPKISTNLTTFKPMIGTTTVSNINTAWERVSIEMPYDPATTPKLFGRVEVTLPEITVAPEITVTHPAGAGMTAGSDTVSFGSASIGGAGATRTITLSNQGTTNLTGLAVTIDGPNNPDFTVSTQVPAMLAPGASTPVTVTFKPGAAGTRNATLHIASNDADEAPFDIALIGNGATATELYNTWTAAANLNGAAAAPDAAPFHDGVANLLKYAFNLNAAGPDLRVLAMGTGTAGLPVFTLDRIGTQPHFKVEFLRRKGSGLVYAPKISTNLTTFEPMTGTTTVSNIDSAWERVTIEMPYDPATTPKLFGRVEVTLPEITVAPEITVTHPAGAGVTDGSDTVSFGSASIGGAGATRTLTLSNRGTANLTGLAVTIDGPNNPDFTVSTQIPAMLAPGASTPVTVTFKPGAGGTRNATLHIASNDADETPFDIALTGNGATATDLYNTWAAAANLSGTAAAPDAQPFHDGVNNLLKYAFNLNAAGPDLRVLTTGTGTAGLPVFTLDRIGTQHRFKVEFLRRTGCGLLYAPKISTNLTTFEPMTGTTTVSNIDSAWERVTLVMPYDPATTPKLFGRVEVTLP